MGKEGGLGGIDESEIVAAWESVGAPPSDAGATPFARFCIYTVTLISRRVAAQEGGDFAVFLMTEVMQQHKDLVQAAHMPFLENGNDKISGHCWLVSPTLKDAYRLVIPCVDQTVLFRDINGASFGLLPAIILDRRGGTPKAYAYPKALAFRKKGIN